MYPKCEKHCSRKTTQKEAEDLSIQLCFLTSTVRAPQGVVKGYVLVPGTDGGEGEEEEDGEEEGEKEGVRRRMGVGTGRRLESGMQMGWGVGDREGFVEVDGGRGRSSETELCSVGKEGARSRNPTFTEYLLLSRYLASTVSFHF